MLQILLLILKIVGIIIAVILGILVLLLCTVIFAPIHYRGNAETSGGLKNSRVRIKVTWLFHLLSFGLIYEENQLQWNVRIAWKRFGQEKENEVEDYEKTSMESEKEPGPEDEEDLEETEQEIPQETASHPGTEEERQENKKGMEEIQTTAVPEHEEDDETSEKEKKSVWEKITDKACRFEKKIIGLWEKIKYTFRGICDRIKLLSDKKEKLTQFITDETHRRAFSVARKAVFRFLRRILSGRIRGKIHFGFDDPYYTGRALAWLAIGYPLYGECLLVEPDFEQRILEGQLSVKGYVMILDAVILAWTLFWCREVRKTYRDIKSFEL